MQSDNPYIVTTADCNDDFQMSVYPGVKDDIRAAAARVVPTVNGVKQAVKAVKDGAKAAKEIAKTKIEKAAWYLAPADM